MIAITAEVASNSPLVIVDLVQQLKATVKDALDSVLVEQHSKGCFSLFLKIFFFQ